PKTGEFNQNKSDLTPVKTGKKQCHTPKREKRMQQQQTKTIKHTIEFSNNRPDFWATSPLYYVERLSSNRLRRIFRSGPLRLPRPFGRGRLV
ncbi:hypothetical protein, partial [Mycolicibacterium sp. 624]|uniref:hypothetical protein n=1 Tax=Mycolicibacterium sp. 624 TaxID=3156314 RepID=UPI0033960EDB